MSSSFQPVLDRIATDLANTPGRGRPADYIPALASVDPRRFGMAVAELDGTVYGVGDWWAPFSAQSITKAFTLALALSLEGKTLWEHVGREPSVGNPFNSLVQLEYGNGIPRPARTAIATLKTWRLLRKLRCSTSRIDDGEDQVLGFRRFQGLNLPLHGMGGLEPVMAGEGRPLRVDVLALGRG